MSRANANEEYDDFAPTLEEGDEMESFVQVYDSFVHSLFV